jgi:hypothetical protein
VHRVVDGSAVPAGKNADSDPPFPEQIDPLKLTS